MFHVANEILWKEIARTQLALAEVGFLSFNSFCHLSWLFYNVDSTKDDDRMHEKTEEEKHAANRCILLE